MNDAYIINDFLSKGAQHGLLPKARLTQREERPSSKQMGTRSGGGLGYGPTSGPKIAITNTSLTSVHLDTRGLWVREMNKASQCP